LFPFVCDKELWWASDTTFPELCDHIHLFPSCERWFVTFYKNRQPAYHSIVSRHGGKQDVLRSNR